MDHYRSRLIKFLTRSVRALATLMLIALVVACSSPASTELMPAVNADLSHVYRLGTGDRVRISVFDEANLSGEFPVDADGTVSLPLIGPVPASGKTTAELTQEIRSRLLAGYLRDPKVSIDVLSYRPYYILGEVSRPGEYPYTVGLTALEAVAKAQGFTYRANRRQVFLRHSDSPHEFEVALTSSTPILPGDTVRIGERYF